MDVRMGRHAPQNAREENMPWMHVLLYRNKIPGLVQKVDESMARKPERGQAWGGPPEWETAKRQLEVERQCGGKVRYKTKEAAVVATNCIRVSPNRDSLAEKLSAYQCTVCNGWHVGHGTAYKKGREYTSTLRLRTED